MYSLRKVPNCQASIMLASTFGKAFSLLQHETSNPRIRKLWVLYADFIRTSIFTSKIIWLCIFSPVWGNAVKNIWVCLRGGHLKNIYDMPLSCTDPQNASEMMSQSVLNSRFEVDSSAFS